MSNNTKKSLFSLILFLSIFFISFSLAEGINLTDQQKADSCIKSSNLSIVDLQSNNFSIERVTDIFEEAIVINDAQVLIENKQKGKGNFDVTLKKCEEIQDLYDLAFESRDSLNSLIKFYQEEIIDGVDTSTADLIISEINLEITNERYERVPALIDKAYEEISRLRAENTQLKLFYESTTKGFVSFIYKNKIAVISVLSVLVLFFLIYRVAIYKMIIKRKIEKLTIRKKTLNSLLQKTQKDYFQDGKISDSDYNIRIKNFGEMVRDIDRQIPLLNEQLAKISRRKELLKNTKADKRVNDLKEIAKQDKPKKTQVKKTEKKKKR